MTDKNCSICGKQIDANNTTGKCSLCAIGLAPTSRLQRDANQIQYTGASGRTLSGSNCPDCQAELSLADISQKYCSICGEVLRTEVIQSAVHIRQTAHDVAFPKFRAFADTYGYK